MLKKLWNYQIKKRLKETPYAFLIDPAPQGEYVSIDTETTGLDPKKDEIISIGAVKIRQNRILTSQALYLHVKPTKPIDPKSITIHHLRHCDLKEALSIDEAIDQLLHFIGPCPLVGYYLSFDVALINRWTKSHLSITLPNKLIEVSALYYDKKIGTIPQGNVDLRFDTIAKDVGIPMFGKHNALNDAIMSAMIFIKLQYIKKL